jgi:magnesium transporter
MTTALLFERDDVETVDDWQSVVESLGRSSLLWLDIDRTDPPQFRELSATLGLSPESEQSLASLDGHSPFLGDFGSYVHVTALAPAHNDGRAELVKIECLVGKHWVVTIHEGSVAVLENFRERASGSGDTGRLEGPELLANLLDWVLHGYLESFEEIERSLEEFDVRAMDGELDGTEEELRRLVELRRAIGDLRRALTAHREVFLALTRPELEGIATAKCAERFQHLHARLEDVVQAARDSRDSVVGSFDVLIARTEQRTNEIVKVLTLGSMLLLPGALIAGVLGMNFKIGIFDDASYFWAVIAVIVGIAAATLVAARLRRWI